MSIPKKYLTEKVILTESRVDGNSILRILTQNNSINRDDPNIEYYEKLADWADKHQNKTGPIDLSTIKLSDDSLITNNKLAKSTNHLGHTLSQLKNLMAQEGKYNPDDAKSSLIQKTTLEILAGLSGIKGNITLPEAPKEKPTEPTETEDTNTEEKSKPYQGMDWTAEKAKRLANTEGKTTSEVLEQFYDDYYRVEYASLAEDADNIVAKLKSLDSILIQEFNKLGYNPDVNPFAQFLKNLIEHKRDIFDKLTTNTYGAIHNSFIKKHITGNMLGKLDENSNKNILFCTDLYNYKGLDIVNYLSFQKTIFDEAKSSEEYSADPWQITIKILIQQESQLQTAGTYAEKVNALLDSPDVILPTQGKLRSVSEISELYRYIFNNALETDKTNEYNKLDEVVSRAKRKQVVLSMIRFILDQDKFKKEYPKQAATYENWLTEIQYKRNNNNIKKSRDILSDDFNIDTEDMLEIVKKLIKVYNSSKKARAKN